MTPTSATAATATRAPRRESDSQLIDRLVLGLPPRAVLTQRMLWLHADGWTPAEIAARYGTTADAVTQRLHRSRRAAR